MDHDDIGRIGKVAHGALRGTIAAMAMTGVRTVTQSLGFLPESPPEAVVQRGAGFRKSQTDPRRHQVVIQLAHWGYGAVGGGIFGAMPEELRRRAWAGPIYGLTLWLGFEAAIAPVVGIRRRGEAAERMSLMLDHLLYGLVLSEIRRRPQR